MSGIQTGIELNDQFSGVLYTIINSVDLAVSAMYDMQESMNADIDTSGIEGARDEINRAAAAMDEFNAAVSRQVVPDIVPPAVDEGNQEPIPVPIDPLIPDPLVENPDPVPLPIQPNAPPDPVEIQTDIQIEAPDSLAVDVAPVVTEQPQIEVPEQIEIPVCLTEDEQRIGQMRQQLQGIEQVQQAISEIGKNAYVLPDGAAEKISGLNREVQRLQAGVDYLEENPFDLDASFAQLQIESMQKGIDEVISSQSELNSLLGNTSGQTVKMPVENPAPVNVPIHWETDGVEAFTGTGVDRFRQEVQSANNMLNTLNQTQAHIAQVASGMDILPDAAVQDMNTMQQRLQTIQQRIQQIENNPVNIGADTANAELEQLRAQLDRMVQEQNELNEAMQNMDVSAANDVYLRLSQTVSGTERYIRDNTDEQGRFNQEIQAGTRQADGLMDAIKGAVAAYATMQTMGDIINLSDTMTQTTARLDLIVDDGGSIEELQNKIFASAQDARGSYMATADAVSKLGMQASQAFTSNDELIAFTELLNKSFVNAGTSVQGVESVMLQLTQSMAAGKLQGEELNAVLDNAAPIVQNIQRYLEEVQNIDARNIKELASEGVITADVVKNAMFYAAGEINAKFESMPMTWGQIWQLMQNTALVAFQPVLQRMNDIANSQAFQTFVNGAIEAMATLANILLNIFDLAATVGGFIADNWSIISPIIYGVIAALAIYAVYQGITAAATAIVTAAQWAWNAAMSASPLTWIILLIIALIAVIFAVCNAIAKMTGVANTGFGVICGGVNVVIQFFKNLGLSVANIALAIWNAICALCSNMMTAFNNAICSIQSWFYNLLSTACSVIAGICEALNKLPFVEFDYSGITSAADDYAAKASAAAGNKEDYTNVADAFSKGLNTFDVFQDGWVSDAFNAGASWGDGVADAVSNFSLSDLFGGTDIPNVGDYTSGFDNAIASSGIGNNVGDIAGNTGDIAGDTGSIKDAMDITQEDLKYLRDIAEAEAINRFTTAEIKIEQNNTNNISNEMDIDGVVNKLTEAAREAIETTTEGVHE